MSISGSSSAMPLGSGDAARDVRGSRISRSHLNQVKLIDHTLKEMHAAQEQKRTMMQGLLELDSAFADPAHVMGDLPTHYSEQFIKMMSELGRMQASLARAEIKLQRGEVGIQDAERRVEQLQSEKARLKTHLETLVAQLGFYRGQGANVLQVLHQKIVEATYAVIHSATCSEYAGRVGGEVPFMAALRQGVLDASKQGVERSIAQLMAKGVDPALAGSLLGVTFACRAALDFPKLIDFKSSYSKWVARLYAIELGIEASTLDSSSRVFQEQSNLACQIFIEDLSGLKRKLEAGVRAQQTLGRIPEPKMTQALISLDTAFNLLVNNRQSASRTLRMLANGLPELGNSDAMRSMEGSVDEMVTKCRGIEFELERKASELIAAQGVLEREQETVRQMGRELKQLRNERMKWIGNLSRTTQKLERHKERLIVERLCSLSKVEQKLEQSFLELCVSRHGAPAMIAEHAAERVLRRHLLEPERLRQRLRGTDPEMRDWAPTVVSSSYHNVYEATKALRAVLNDAYGLSSHGVPVNRREVRHSDCEGQSVRLLDPVVGALDYEEHQSPINGSVYSGQWVGTDGAIEGFTVTHLHPAHLTS